MQQIIKLLLWTFVVGFVLFALHYAYKELKLRNQVIDVLMLETISQESDIMVIDKAVDATTAQVTTQQFTTGQDKMRQHELRHMSQKIKQQVNGNDSSVGLAPAVEVQKPKFTTGQEDMKRRAWELNNKNKQQGGLTQNIDQQVKGEASSIGLARPAPVVEVQKPEFTPEQEEMRRNQIASGQPVIGFVGSAPVVPEKPAQTQPSSAIMTAPAQVKARIEAAQKRLTEQAQAMATQTQQHILPRATAATSARANSNIEATGVKVERINCNTCTKSKTVDSNRSSLIGRLNELNTMLINLYERAIGAYLEAGLSESDGRIQHAKREQNAARRELQMQM